MLYKHKELIEKYGNGYQIKKRIATGKLYKREDGLYTDEENINLTDIIAKKYPNAVITGLTAYYCYGLYNINPPVVHVATQRDTTRINNPAIAQHFVAKSIYKKGIVSLKFNNSFVKIYDKEKLFVELIRNQDKYSHSQYITILNNYKNIINTLNKQKINDYASVYPNSKKLNEEIKKYV